MGFRQFEAIPTKGIPDMKIASLAAAIALGSLATPAFAQDKPADHANHADHSDHAGQTDDANAEAKTAKFTLDTPIEQLMADEKAKAVVVENFGGEDVSQHPMYPQFKAMSLKAVAPFSQGMITDEMLTKIEAGLAEIK